MLMCDRGKEAEVFRNRIIERRVYKYDDSDHEVRQEALDRAGLMKVRKQLRTESKTTGFTEAVYKLSLEERGVIWLKDQAVVESYPMDRISLSLGCLTMVSKEMAVEDRLKKTEAALQAANRKLERWPIWTALPKSGTAAPLTVCSCGNGSGCAGRVGPCP